MTSYENRSVARVKNIGGEKRRVKMVIRHQQRMNWMKNHPDSDFAKLWRGEYEPA